MLDQTTAIEALENSGNGIFIVGPEGTIQLWNRWMSRHSGTPGEQAIGKLPSAVFGSKLPMRFEQAVNQALQAGQSSVLSHSINPNILPLYPEGNSNTEPLPHAIRVRAYTGAEQQRCCLVEITDMRAALQREQLLRSQGRDLRLLAQRHEEQSNYARALVDSAQDAQITINSEGLIRDLNPAARKLFKVDADAPLGQSIQTWLPDYAAHPRVSDIDRQQPVFEIEAKKSDGNQFPAEVSVSRFSVKQVPHQLLVIRDLTDRKQYEESLFRERDFAQATLASIHEAVITTDREGRISSANAAACELLNKGVDAILDRPVLNLVTFAGIDERCAARDALDAALNKAATYEFDSANPPEMRYPDGERIYVSGRISPLNSVDEGVVGCLLVLRDVTLNKRMNEILTYQATHDDLTSLINRREFERVLTDMLDERVSDSSNILLYIDLDQFKLVNDSCGHNAGDQLLRQLTSLLRTRLRHTDTLARLGGDEFAVLLPNCELGIGQRIAEELRRTVSEFRFHWNDRAFALGASIGLVSIDDSMDSMAVVLAAADSACYIAKENGRDQVITYQADGDEEQRRRSEMGQAARVRDSLENGRFTLYCQPIVPIGDTGDGTWGIEILVRMFDENNELVPPFAFIPAAERYNLMSHIDRWVVDAVCDYWTEHREKMETLNKVAINLSGQSVANDDFLRHVIHTVNAHGLPWNKLCFEITETAAVASIEKAQAFMSRLTRLGCRFALDDFGSGLSSFTYLKHLPVHFLKIDGAFVRDMLVDEIDAAMVRSISDIGRSMGLETIAEFVEDQDIIAALDEAGVGWAQGYGICRPIPLKELDSFAPEQQADDQAQSA